MRTHLTSIAAAIALAVAAVPVGGPPVASAGSKPTAASGRCTPHLVPVELQNGQRHRIYGELCTPRRLNSRTPVQVLIHGGTYDHRYWDWPLRPDRQSYVRHATAHGYATFNIDRLGFGRSDRVDGRTLDFATSGYAVHQLVTGLRAGAIGGHRFRQVVLNGHSLGGVVAETAAAHGGVDALIISGIPNHPGDGGDDDDGPAAAFYPAEQDPKFARSPWAGGYLTTRPGIRPHLFLHKGSYTWGTPWFEELFKDTVPVAELEAVNGEAAADPPRATRIPTLHVLGRYDALHCHQTGDCTTDPTGRGTDLFVEDSGHSINVGKGAPRFYRETFTWLAGIGLP